MDERSYSRRKRSWFLAFASGALGAMAFHWLWRIHPTWFGLLWVRATSYPVGFFAESGLIRNAAILNGLCEVTAISGIAVAWGLLGWWLAASWPHNERPQVARLSTVAMAVSALAFACLLLAWPTPETFRTPAQELVRAGSSGNLKQVVELLDRGADVNALDVESGEGVLHLVVQTGNVDLARTLLDRGADVNLRDRYDMTPLDRAVNALEEHPRMVALLLDRGARPTDGKFRHSPLCTAAERGYVGIARVLLEKGSEVSREGPDGRLPLCVAAYYGRKGLIRLFLASGADINRCDRKGTPLIIVAGNTYRKDCLGLCRALIRAGADVNAKTPDGDTALMRAAHGGSLEVVQLLLSRGADPNARNRNGMTPLYEAVMADDGPVVKALLDAGGDVNQPGLWGKSPLQIAEEGEKDEALGAIEAVRKKVRQPAAGTASSGGRR